jgi:plasmid stabilization system protein ParE
MARVRPLLAVESDIEDAPRFTLLRFGVEKYHDYTALIEEAFAALAENPNAGRARADIDPDAWIYHIAKPGRNARHVLLYRIVHPELVEVFALAHDAMNLPRRWRSRSGSR